MRTIGYTPFMIILLSAFLAGCSQGKSNHSPETRLIQLGGVEYPEFSENNVIQLKKSDFPKGEILSIQKTPLDLMIELRETDVFVKGNYLIVKHLEMREGAYLLHVVSLPDYKVVAKLAPFGEGPDEFNDIRVILTEEADKLCYVWNLHNNQIFTLTSNLRLEEYGRLPETIESRYLAGAPLCVGENQMQVTFSSGEGMGIGTVNLKDSTTRGTIPFQFTKGAWGFFYIGVLGHSFSKKREAFAFTYHDRIAFFDFDGGNAKMCRFGNKTLRTTTSPENPIYYYSCFASDKYVYAIYRESENDADQRNPLYLEQFNWDGNPVARYLLPEDRGLYSGCATDDDSTIYLVDYYEDEFLYKVVLSKR